MSEDKSDWQKRHENKLDSLIRKLEYERKNGLRKKTENRHHPAEIALIAVTLTACAGLFNEGAFFGIYLIGAALTVVDLPKLIGEDQNQILKTLKGKPLPYLAAGLCTSIVLQASGNPIPPPELGLLADITLTTIQALSNVIL